MKGFSLIELLVSVAIFVLIAIAVGSFARDVFFYNSISSGSLQTAHDARAIMRTMVQELRTASVASNGSFPIFTAGTSSIAFFSDVDNDATKEQIRYFIDGTVLKKGVTEPSGSPLTYNIENESVKVLAEHIRNSTSTSMFEYFGSLYPENTNALTQPVTVSEVRLVKINLELDVDQNRAPVRRSFTTQVSLRNLKDNL
jgi:prepilin-type N-terminal cleavage/methylation domain-containing protein